MKIGFDARMIDHPGIGKYIRNILSEMIDESIDDEFILYGSRYKLADFKKTKSSIREYGAPVYSFEELFLDPFSKERFDVMHIPHFNVPSHKPHNLVVTIHDLIYLKLTDSSPLYKRVAAKPVISNAVNKADRIIAVSENTKKDIIENFPGTEDKISVIYEGADPVFKKVEDDERKQIVRLRYDLPTDMILCVGSLKRHKNIERLVDAYIDLKHRGIKHRPAEDKHDRRRISRRGAARRPCHAV
jgi:glycosyltransferase involved in cell wall biosynthesis